MKKSLIIVLLLLVPTIYAMNMWMSYTIFDDIKVQPGFKGYYQVDFCNAGCYNKYMAEWGTHDNVTYVLDVSVAGTGARFFKELPKKVITISNTTSYRYNVYLNVPKNTKPGNYTYELCGKSCDALGSINLCLELCKSGKVIVN